MEHLTALTFVAMGLGIGVQTWLIIRYLIDRMDKKMQAERTERLGEQAKINQELSNFRDTHVRRDDFHRHVDNVEKQIGNVVIMITNLGAKFDSRLDTIISMITSKKGFKDDE